jgi:hypothetical protein
MNITSATERRMTPSKPKSVAGGDSLDRLVRESLAYDDLFTIECNLCGKINPLFDWTSTEIHGPLPHGVYQCPSCNAAFRRQWNPKKKPWEAGVSCVPVESRL